MRVCVGPLSGTSKNWLSATLSSRDRPNWLRQQFKTEISISTRLRAPVYRSVTLTSGSSFSLGSSPFSTRRTGSTREFHS
jgi:hypothetical protein